MIIEIFLVGGGGIWAVGEWSLASSQQPLRLIENHLMFDLLEVVGLSTGVRCGLATELYDEFIPPLGLHIVGFKSVEIFIDVVEVSMRVIGVNRGGPEVWKWPFASVFTVVWFVVDGVEDMGVMIEETVEVVVVEGDTTPEMVPLVDMVRPDVGDLREVSKLSIFSFCSSFSSFVFTQISSSNAPLSSPST